MGHVQVLISLLLINRGLHYSLLHVWMPAIIAYVTRMHANAHTHTHILEYCPMLPQGNANNILLLLDAPTWLWDRCGRLNNYCPPASSVMDLVFRRSDGCHVSVETVHPSLLRSSSLSSPGWYHLQSLSSSVVLVSPLYVANPPQSRFPAPLCDTLYLQALLDVFVSHMVS